VDNEREVGLILVQTRLKKNKKAGEIARSLNVHGSIVSDWENGICPIPVGRVRSVIKVYGLDAKEFIKKLREAKKEHDMFIECRRTPKKRVSQPSDWFPGEILSRRDAHRANKSLRNRD